MKTFKILIISSLILASLNSYAAIPAKVATETVELLAKQSTKVLSTSSKKLAAEALAKNVARYGAKYGDNVLAFTKAGGIDAIEATTKYGDDFLELCAKNPNAIKPLAMNADTYIPLAKRYGDDFLKLEAVAPGMTKNIVNTYGDDAVELLATKNADDVSKLLGTAKRCDSPEAKALLLKNFSTSKNPTLFIERLSPKQMMAGGVGVATITAAGGVSVAAIVASYQISDGVQEGLVEVSKNSPEVFADTVSNMGSQFIYIGVLVVILFIILALSVAKGPIFLLKKVGDCIYATLRGIKNLCLKIFSKDKPKEDTKEEDTSEKR